METALVLIALAFGVYAGWRMLGRAVRVVWARFVSSVFAQQAWAWIVAWGQAPVVFEPSDSQDAPPSEVPSTASDGAALGIQDGKSDEPLNLTSVEIVRGLANVKRIDSDGNAVWLSKDKIAALAGIRAADARAIIDEVRGTEPPPQPGKPRTPHADREYDPTKFRGEAKTA